MPPIPKVNSPLAVAVIKHVIRVRQRDLTVNIFLLGRIGIEVSGCVRIVGFDDVLDILGGNEFSGGGGSGDRRKEIFHLGGLNAWCAVILRRVLDRVPLESFSAPRIFVKLPPPRKVAV